MNIAAIGHRLETLHEGLTVFRDGGTAPVPLVNTDIAVEIKAGLATVRTTRSFHNAEDVPIEAVLTMPVGFDAVVTDLRATIDGRQLVATSKPAEAARVEYEDAVDRGKMAVLHEEALRGVHVLSVGQLAPGKDVDVEIETVCALGVAGGAPFLRIPVTVGQLYGASPLAPADDLSASTSVTHKATLEVAADASEVLLDGRKISHGEPLELMLDHAIELRLPAGVFGSSWGTAADGGEVRIDLEPVATGEAPLDAAVLVDRSGSTAASVAGQSGKTVWQAIRDGLRIGFSNLDAQDKISLWQFASTCGALGGSEGPDVAGLVSKLDGPAGGTELGDAVDKVLSSGARDILVLTDGQTWAHTVDDLKGRSARISAILVGSGSLDANIGQLCAMTGGQLFYTSGDDVAAAIALAIASLRQPAGATEGAVEGGRPISTSAVRGGVEITARWFHPAGAAPPDAVGRFAAALALPILPAKVADGWAAAHTLCTHRTSLLLVDEQGETADALPQMRKVALMDPSEDVMYSMSFDDSEEPIRASYRMPQPSDGGYSEDLPRNSGRSKGAANELGRIKQLFFDLRWDEIGERLLSADFSDLSAEQLEIVLVMAENQDFKEIAIRNGIVPEVLILGKIADLVGSRWAKRFYRKVCGNLPPSELSAFPSI